MNPLKSLARGTYRGINSIGKAIGDEFSPIGQALKPLPAYTPNPGQIGQLPSQVVQVPKQAISNQQSMPITNLRNGLANGGGALGGFARHYQDIQSYKKGGKVDKTGLAYLHKGETVISNHMKKHCSKCGGKHVTHEHKGDPDTYAKARTKALSNKVENEKVTKRYSKKEENLKGRNENQ